jgi:hypothetical protein
MATTNGRMTSEQNRIAYLTYSCEYGYNRNDKEKKNPIPEAKAVQDWDELLVRRFPQRNSGGAAFVLKIIRYVKDKNR